VEFKASIPTKMLSPSLRASRVGLNGKLHNDKDYCNRPYRFLTFFHLPHKETEKVKKDITDCADDATGDYLNMIMIGNLIFVPEYNNQTDRLAHKLIETVFQPKYLSWKKN
jgi:agmatine/peptidylarginine deiminase